MSTTPQISKAFDTAHAEVYDRQFEAIRAVKDALHLLLRVQLSALPAEARILVAGAGTGAEVRFLAPLFPGWRFTLVDPAAAMLEVARRHAEAEGFAERCEFHVGFVSSLDEAGFDAASSVLVSQFLADPAQRLAYFQDIAARLRPGGLLFNADLAADRDDPGFGVAMELWLGLLGLSGMMTEERKPQYRAMFGRDVAAQGPAEVEALIREAGFTAPVACYQAGLIHGWVASRA